MMQTARDPLATRNERVKLFAVFLNAIGLGLIGFAVLRPITESLANANLSALWWGMVGLALHGLSHYILHSSGTAQRGEAMTFFEFIVPVIALALAGIGILILHRSGKALDRQNDHPAE